MPKKLTRMLLTVLLALSLTLLLSGCDERPRLATPPVEWAEPVADPVVPEGEAVCADGARCLSDAETGSLLADFSAALDKANRKLLKLKDWIVTARDSQ